MTWNVTDWGNVSTGQDENQTVSGDSLDGEGLGGADVAAIVVMSFIAVTGFQGNLSVAVVIINNPSLRTSMTNLFVLNLVIVDLLACVLALPLAVVAFSLRNSNQDFQMCEVSGFFSTSFMLCSMLTLCVISMDRFYSIAMPLHHAAHSTPLIALVVIVSAWLVGILVASLPCIGLNSYKFKHQGRICSFEWAGDKNDRAFVITIFIISFLIPSLVILSMYSSIFCIARKAARTVAPQPSESTHSTIVNPEQETNRADNSQNPTNSKEIVVSTIDTFIERRPPHRRILSLSSDYNGYPFTSMGGCQQSSTRQIESPVGQDVLSDMTSSLQNINLSNTLASGYGGDAFPVSSIRQNRQSITTFKSTDSRLINCDQEYCKRHPRDKNSGKFCCHCTTQIESLPQENIPEIEKISHTSKTIPIISQNMPLRGTGSESSHSSETSYQKLGTIGAQLSTQSRCQPTPSTSIQPNAQSNQPLPVTSRPKHTKAFRTVMVIVLSYLLLWGPYFLCQVHQSRGGSVSSSSQLIVSWLGFTSYTIHPFLYGGMNRLIRDELSRLYKTILVWIKALAYCLCWSCCRCTCIHIPKDFFTPKSDDSNNNSAVAVHCMPWLTTVEEEDEDEEECYEGNDVSEMHGGERRRRKNNKKETDQEDHTESFFQFLQRTQDGDSQVPQSLVVENGSTI